MPANDSGGVVCSSFLLLCGHPGRRQAETPLIQPVQKSRASSDRQPSNPEVMAELEREILSFDPSREIDREIKLPFGGGQMSNPSVAETNRSVPDEPRQGITARLSELQDAPGYLQSWHKLG